MIVATCVCCGRTTETHFDEVCERSAHHIELRIRHLFANGWNVDVYGDWLCPFCDGGDVASPDSRPHRHASCQRPRVPYSPTRAGA